MSLRHAILGLLSQKPMTGFDLLKEFDVAQSVIWPAPQNEVYRVLAALAGEGLIEEVSAGARGAKTYAITAPGSSELAAWLAAPSDYALRYDPILKAVFLRDAPPALRRARAGADLDFFEAQLKVLREIGAKRAAAPDAPDPRVDARRLAIAFYEAMAGWARAILNE